jgi:hypothetical protein
VPEANALDPLKIEKELSANIKMIKLSLSDTLVATDAREAILNMPLMK